MFGFYVSPWFSYNVIYVYIILNKHIYKIAAFYTKEQKNMQNDLVKFDKNFCGKNKKIL